MSVPITIKVFQPSGAVTVLKYRASERDKAMRVWDQVVEDCVPGQKVQLINETNDRIVCEYTNYRQS